MEVEALVPGQHAEHDAGRTPGLHELHPGVWSLGMDFRMLVPFSLAYLVRDDRGGIHVVDPGGDSPENRDRLRLALEQVGSSVETVRSIAVTHMHRDHVGLAAWLSEASGAPVRMHGADAEELRAGAADGRYSRDLESLATRWGVPGEDVALLAPNDYRSWVTMVPERIEPVEHGDDLGIPGVAVRVVHTPGHTRGHACFVLDGARLVLTGDQLLPHIHPPLGKDGSGGRTAVRDVLRSLDALAEFDDFGVGPGHGFCFRPLGPRRAAVTAHIRQRAAGVADGLQRDADASVWEIARNLRWGPGWQNLAGANLQSALAQTALFMHYVRSGQDADGS